MSPSPPTRLTGTTLSVEGHVRWLGPRPAPSRLATSASVQRVCGPEVEDNSFRVDEGGGVAEVVVWAEGAAEPPSVSAPEAVLDQRGCLYVPAVLAARAGGTLRLRNSDALTHTVHAVQQGRSLFNVAMPLEHLELVQRLPAQAGVLEVRCDVHPWMHASVRTFEHPHFTTTRTDGHFELAGLARGDVEVHAWHPKLGEASQRVQLREGVAHTDFDFGGKP